MLAFALPLAGGSSLGVDTHVVARDVPGSGFQFVPAALIVDVSGDLMLTNTDLAGHDLVAVESGPETQPWCGRFSRDCPLFASEIVGLGRQARVHGTETLPASDPFGKVVTYAFYCSVHPWMTGTLTTV